jgi:hypothetical protein
MLLPDNTYSCDGYVRGDYRSGNGANRTGDSSLCMCRPKFRVTTAAGHVSELCGYHVRVWRKFQRSHLQRTGSTSITIDDLPRPTRSLTAIAPETR